MSERVEAHVPSCEVQPHVNPHGRLQGFTKEITFDRDLWHGWIKDYDGGTLMECIINPKVWGLGQSCAYDWTE